MPAGRPTKLTSEIQRRICKSVAAGNYYQAACNSVGVSLRAFCGWMSRGKREKSGKYFQFVQAIMAAQAQAEEEIVGQWRSQIPDNWQAARDFLARRFPDRWGPKEKISQEIHGKDGGAVRLHIVEEIIEAHPEEAPPAIDPPAGE